MIYCRPLFKVYEDLLRVLEGVYVSGDSAMDRACDVLHEMVYNNEREIIVELPHGGESFKVVDLGLSDSPFGNVWFCGVC